MPQKITNRTIARKSRKGVHGRKAKPGTKHKGPSKPKASAPAVIAHSIFALTLKPKKGVEIYFKKGGKKKGAYHSIDDDYEQMYRDLLACYSRAYYLLKGEKFTVDFVKMGLSLETGLSAVLRNFERDILPNGYQYNVDRSDNEESNPYYFTIFKDLDFPNYWHSFAIKHAVLHLEKKNPKLLRLFLIFINSFSQSLDIDTWYGYTAGYAGDWIEQKISDMQAEYDLDFATPDEFFLAAKENDEVKEYKDAVDTLDEYKSGLAAHYEKELKEAPVRSAKQILAQLKKLRSRSPIAKVIREGCALMQEGYTLGNFIYREMEESNDGMGLRLEMQATILWDGNDLYTAMQSEMIDSESQEGIWPPYARYAITPDSREIDTEWLKKAEQWPMKLSDYHKFASTILESYEPKEVKK